MIFLRRSIVFKDIPDYKYQATLVWPQASKKPSTATLQTADELNQLMIRFSVECNRPRYNNFGADLSKSASPTPSQTSNASRISASGPPGFAAQVAALSASNNGFAAEAKPKFDYDLPLEALLDDGGDDIDNEAEILMWIKDFLTLELGKLGGNVPMLLMNNIRSYSSEDMVLQVKRFGPDKGAIASDHL